METNSTCCGDEPYNDAERLMQRTASGCCTKHSVSTAGRPSPYEKHHSTVKDACELAEELHVPNLLLYHTEDKNITHRKELYTAEGTEYYHGNLYIPEDLETIEL